MKKKITEFEEINLDNITDLDTLIAKLTEAKEKGFEWYGRTYQLGYYDSVEDITIELVKR